MISYNPFEAMAPGPNVYFLDEKSLIDMVAMDTMATVVVVTNQSRKS